MGNCRSAKAEHDDESSEKSNTNTHAKTYIIIEKVSFGENLNTYNREEFSKAASHGHFKRIQEREFQSDMEDNTVRVSTLSTFLSYQCELQRSKCCFVG